MAKFKIYAVRSGKSPGIYHSWEECQTQVKGYSGAEYKSFSCEEDAIAYLNGTYVENKPSSAEIDVCTDFVAYVDGSYCNDTGMFSCGAVIVRSDKVIYEISEAFCIQDMVSMRNVAGEIMGMVRAVQYLISHGVKDVTVVHDYEGISKWCTGEWQTKKSGTKSFKKFYDEASKKINIQFIKVKGHSGIQYNERADRLAKLALKAK